MVKSAKILRVFKPGKAAPAPAPRQQVSPGEKFAKWDAKCDLTATGEKKFDIVKDTDGKITDYLNVKITGYLSTFQHVTNADRDGDAVEKGAFKDGLSAFMKNPVLLIDHRNSVDNIAGQFTEVQEDSKGLKVTASLSNSPTERMRHIRALVAEGNLKTLSMGGIFFFKDDPSGMRRGRIIHKVDLMEGSLVSIPANPDALFSVRECTESESKQFQAEAA